MFDLAKYVASPNLDQVIDLVESIFKKEAEKEDLMGTFNKYFYECIHLFMIFEAELKRPTVWEEAMKRIEFMKICFDYLEVKRGPIHAFDPVTVRLTEHFSFRVIGTKEFNMSNILSRPVTQPPLLQAVVHNTERVKRLTREKHTLLMLGLAMAAGFKFPPGMKADGYYLEKIMAYFIYGSGIKLDKTDKETEKIVLTKIACFLNVMVHAYNYHVGNARVMDVPEIKLVDYLSYICKFSLHENSHPLLLTQTKHVLIDCLRESEDDQVIEYALDAIWCLSFFPKNRASLHNSIQPLLKKHEKHEEDVIAYKAKYLGDFLSSVKKTNQNVEETDVRLSVPNASEYLNNPNVEEEQRQKIKSYAERVRDLCQKCATTSDLDSALKDLWNAVLDIKFRISVLDILVEHGVHDLLTGRFFLEVPDDQKIYHIEKFELVYGYTARSNFSELLLKGNFCGQLLDLLDRQGRDVTEHESIKRSYDAIISLINLLILQSKNAEKYLANLPIEQHCKVALEKLDKNAYNEARVLIVLSASTIGKDRQSIDKMGFKSGDLALFLKERSIDYIKAGGYENGVVALLESLSYLATSEKYARELILYNVLRPCWHLIQGAPPESCLIKALELLWTLAFTQQNAIRKCPAMLFRVGALSKHENPVIIQLVNSIKTALNGQIEEPTSETHVMISYCWSQKKQVHRLANALKEAGKRVWIDVEKMEGDTFQRMAEGVENAHVVICCTSEEYFNSYACNKEAGYAGSLKKNMIFAKFQHNYKHSGWLGLLQGAELYYDMMDGNGNKFDEHVASILEKISAFEGQKIQQKKIAVPPPSQPQ